MTAPTSLSQDELKTLVGQAALQYVVPGELLGTTPIAVATPQGPAQGRLLQRLIPVPGTAGLARQLRQPVAHHLQVLLLAEGIERQPQAKAIR